MAQIHNCENLEALVMKLGFLPFFKNDIPGFSVEEYTPKELWFSKECDGPWEWKGPIAGNGNCAYGKLFNKKAGFVSMDWFPDLVNYRRSIYDNRQSREKAVYDTIAGRESLLSKEIKARHPQMEALDSVVTRLQMGTWIVVADFEYQYDKNLNRYGWGIARYTTPEALFGKRTIQKQTPCPPEESKQKIMDYLSALLPKATKAQILKIVG